jgi:monoamine oxidase
VAHTPALNWLQRLYREFEIAERRGCSVEQIQNQKLQLRSTRRGFLQAAGGAAAAAALTRPKLLAGSAPRIAIVGGGIAGLSAALTLQDAGYATTIYEASSRIGGRMFSDTTSWANNQVTEHCGELIDSGHKTILKLANRFNIPVDDLSAAEPRHSTETYWFFGQYYTRTQANADFNAVYNAVKQDLNAAGYPTLYNKYNSAGFALDHMSVYEWIETRVPGGHGSPMGQLLDVAYNIEYGAETNQQSSLNLIYLLGYNAPGTFRLFGRSDERYHMRGGNERLPRAIAAALPEGSIQTGTALTAISLNGDGTYTLVFKKGSSRFSVTADRVILALPFSVLRNLDYSRAGFSQVKTTAIEELGYGTNSKLHVQFASRYWNQPGPWGVSTGSSYADTGYQNTWDVTRAQPGATGILVDYTGGSIGASFKGDAGKRSVVEGYAQQFLSQLEPVFPGIWGQWNGRVTLDTPWRSPYLLGSYSYWKVGQYTLFSGSEKERSGNCHFAGEHCSTDFQGYMEGGASEGVRAAKEILSDYRNGIYP